MFKLLKDYFTYWYLQYELITNIYMFEPWEKLLLHEVKMVGITAHEHFLKKSILVDAKLPFWKGTSLLLPVEVVKCGTYLCPLSFDINYQMNGVFDCGDGLLACIIGLISYSSCVYLPTYLVSLWKSYSDLLSDFKTIYY